ncbi:MAG: NarK/NasA family nitrate transporter [Fimbriimonadaceae bacterium]|nr:NarK/NasA family nitrate transporter [Fimbriimonadaceae bacterium]
MADITRWDIEDADFWETTGHAVARRNLLVSVPCLLCAFAVWMMWSVINVRMQDLGFPFSKAQLYLLPAIAGLSGATLRIPNSFLVIIGGGRNVVALTTGLLLLPAIGAGVALASQQTPFWVFCVLAALSGIGGGNFASSMSNINPFFPRRQKGSALGINAGVGNLGVSVTQKLLPLVMGLGLFGGTGMVVAKTGQTLYIQNAGLVWVPILLVLTVLAAARMNNLPLAELGSTAQALGKTAWLLLLGGLAAAVGTVLLASGWSMWLAIAVTIGLSLLPLRYLTPAPVQERLKVQFSIFRDQHTWVMTLLYIMTFGSFIGFSAAFPKLIQDLFKDIPGGALKYGWLGPLVGSLVRPLGGWWSDRWSGAKVTQVSTAALIAATLGAGYAIAQARVAPHPEAWFGVFLTCFLLLFVMTGLGNGSTFQMVPMIFEPQQAGPVLGWTSAVAAYGACVIPTLFSKQIEAQTPERAMWACAAFYVLCLVVNGWYYARRNAVKPC